MINAVGEKFLRAVHFDFHTSPVIKNMLDGFDADAFALRLKDANVQYINFPARCNMGYSYYDTKVGVKYPTLKSNLLPDIITACHKHGIGVSAYINVSLNHELFADHEDFLTVNKDGSRIGQDKKDNFFRVACYNADYKYHLFKEIDEILQMDIDGIFLDCPVFRPCYCERCKADMLKKGYDITSDKDFYDYHALTRLNFLSELRDKIKDKNIKYYFNDVGLPVEFKTHAETECLTTDASLWGYGYYGPHSALASTIYNHRVFMSGRFQGSWGDFGGIKNLASLEYDLYDALMSGAALSIGDHLHPVYGLENEVYRRVKTVFDEHLLYEPFIKNSDPVAEVGVLMSGNSGAAKPFTYGADLMFKELKVPYKIYLADGDFSNLKLLIVCEDIFDNDVLDKKLKDFVKNGNKIIFIGKGIDYGARLNLINYVNVVGDDLSDNAYFTHKGDMRWASYLQSKLIKNVSGVSIADYVSNICNFDYDGRQSHFYRPQGDITEYSACVIGKDTACISFDIFTAYKDMVLKAHRDLFEDVLSYLYQDRFVTVSGLPVTSELAVTASDKHTVLHIKATYPQIKSGRGNIEEHNYIKSSKVSLKGKFKVYALPENKLIKSVYKNGKTVFNTGEILGYKAFLIVTK